MLFGMMGPRNRWLLLLPVLLSGAGCGILTEPDEDQKVAMATAAAIQGVSRCNGNHAAGFAKTAVARTECINGALTLMRPVYPYPDLLDRYLINRLAIAQSFSSGKITLAEANGEFIEQRSKMIEEEERRLLDLRREAARPSMKVRPGALFDHVFKVAICGPNDTSVNCI